MVKAIFWDSDGTLLYGNESFAESFVISCKEVGCEVDIEEARALMHNICSWYRLEIDHSELDGEGWWQSLLGNIASYCKELNLSEEQINRILIIFRNNVINYNYKAYDNANEVLKEFSNIGFENYIISNNFPELEEVFVRLGLGKYISGYIVSASVGYEKPNKRIFEIAKQRAGNPAICYMIGDNPKADYEGGKKAGMIPILVHNNSPECEFCCEELLSLKDFIS